MVNFLLLTMSWSGCRGRISGVQSCPLLSLREPGLVELTKHKQADGTLWRAKHTVKARKTICPGVCLAWHPLEQ